MQKYRRFLFLYDINVKYLLNVFIAEVPQWVYGVLFLASLGVGIGCSYAGPHGTVLIPAWSVIFFTGLSSFSMKGITVEMMKLSVLSCFIAIVLGFSEFLL